MSDVVAVTAIGLNDVVAVDVSTPTHTSVIDVFISGPIGPQGAPGTGPAGPAGPAGPVGPPGPSYTLPVASTSALGGVMVDGSTVTVTAAGVLSATVLGEAPTDGFVYGRHPPTWSRAIAASGDVVDGMANTIRIKHWTTGSGVMSTLASAEIAYNEIDHLLYYGEGSDASGNATTVVEIGGEGRASLANPTMNGIATPGVANQWSRGDHVHPTDTSLVPPAAASALPLMDGTVSVGTSTAYAREDHVHPVNTSPLMGVTDGSEARPGAVGEFFYASLPTSSAVAMASGVVSDVLSLPLPAGDFDIQGSIATTGSSTNLNDIVVWVSEQSSTRPAGDELAQFSVTEINFGSGGQSGADTRTQLVTGTARWNSAIPTIVYLSTSITFTGGTVSAAGAIRARRAR